ncbi:MAG: NAD(P)H-dependent oxidoreductase subunit E [Sterolibacterium sp.]|nr:NAD(P)H-dependent oxidoreductase subunit E [Sterolibacterium sp.]
MKDPADIIDAVLSRHRDDPTRLLQILRETQEELGWLSRKTLAFIARGTRQPLARVEGVASFYSFFHTRPMGRYRVLWSDNITDRMLGSARLMKEMCQKLWLEPGHVSEDGLVSVATTSCTGMCDQGPALLVNYNAIPRLTSQRVAQIVELIRTETPISAWPGEFFQVDDNIRRRDILLANRLNRGDALRTAIVRSPTVQAESSANERTWQDSNLASAPGPLLTLEEIKRANLRGRGGAGFATGTKWEACRNAAGSGPESAHCVICNADEGEPGTFKDRVLLTTQADLVFEGMTIAAYVVGARLGMVYLRGEYRYLRDHLEKILTRRRSEHLLGHNILNQAGFDFDIEIHFGAGAYICGEESALIESLEGKRGVPRNRPPFPVTHGYLGQPTIVNNVETLAAAALIAANGGDWFRSIGTEKSAGSKILSVSGDCERPGIYEYPFGVNVAEVLSDCGAIPAKTQAVQISGPSGVCIASDEFQRRIGFEDLATAGAFMVFNNERDMFEVARNFSHFFAHESCGFCTPCRVGTTLLKNCMDKIEAGHGSEYDINEIFKINHLLQTASHCGLGHTACNPMFDTLQKFRPAYQRRFKSLAFEPAFDLDLALSQARQMTGRDDADAHLKNTMEVKE